VLKDEVKKSERFSNALSTGSKMLKWVPEKKIARGSNVYRTPLIPIPNPSSFPFSPDAIESIFGATPFNLPRQNGAMLQKANVCHGKKTVIMRRIELPLVHR
jgi:hypothetical protein